MKAACGYCGNEFEIMAGHYNRAVKRGDKVYCNRLHSGLGRRSNKTKEQKKKEKAAYDELYRAISPTLKSRRAASFQKNYDPEKQREINKQRYPQHLEYLQTPKYKKWKKEYDERFLAKKAYGEFAEAAIALKKLEAELDSVQIKYDYGITINKSSQKRKRKWQSQLKSQR